MKILTRFLLLMGASLLWNGLAHAEGSCPAGMFPFQFAPNQPPSCAPMGGGSQQAPQQPAQQWERRWGAIATDGPKDALGVATNRVSQEEASLIAMQDCQSKGGMNCKIDAAYDNQCAAVVVGDGGYNVSSRATVDQAIARGMQTCRDAGRVNCHAYYTACSLPVRIR